MIISSGNNKIVKEIIALMKKAKLRNEKGLFIAEGEKIFTELDIDIIDSIYMSESYFLNIGDKIKYKFASKKQYIFSDKIFKQLSDTSTPQGILAICKQNNFGFDEILKNSSTFIILEGLQDPGNLGTIFRTAEASNIDAIILDKNSTDIYKPKVVRAAMGAISRVKHIYVDDLPFCIKQLKENKIKIYAAHLCAKKYYDKYTYPRKLAFMIGNESKGLSDDISDLADEYVKIPIYNKAESLNAAIAASILMYELDRQKRNE